MSPEEVCYDHLLEMNSLRQEGLFCDVHLKVGGESIPMHKVVLASAGKSFIPLLKNMESQDVNNEVTVLEMQGVTVEEINAMVQFMYTGIILYPDVTHLKDLSNQLGFSKLESVCEQYLQRLDEEDGDKESHESNEETKELFMQVCQDENTSKIMLVGSNQDTFDEPVCVNVEKDNSLKDINGSSAKNFIERLVSQHASLDTGVDEKPSNIITIEDGKITSAFVDGTKLEVDDELRNNDCIDSGETSRDQNGTYPTITSTAGNLSVNIGNSNISATETSDAVNSNHSSGIQHLTDPVLDKNQTKLQCAICKIFFNDLAVFTKHEESAHERVCDECEEHFTLLTQYQNHLITIHGKLECSTCLVQFDCQKKLRQHRMVAHPNVLSMCSLCGFTANHTNYIINHLQMSHGVEKNELNMVFRCSLCLFNSVDRAKVRIHYVKSHKILSSDPNDPMCDVCGVTFNNCEELCEHKHTTKGHQSIGLPCKKLKCTFTPCSFYTYLESKLARHMKAHGNYKCSKCGEQFKMLGVYERHLLKHTKYECKLCKIVFKSKRSMKHHNNHKHSDGGGTLYKCAACKFTSPHKSNVKSHQFRLHGILLDEQKEIFQCGLCTYMTVVPSELKTHYNQNHPPEEAKHVCSHCGKKFNTVSHLKTHERFHSDERNFKCDQCSHAAHTKQGLEKHKKKHDNHGNYTCLTCHKIYKKKGNFMRHAISCYGNAQISVEEITTEEELVTEELVP